MKRDLLIGAAIGGVVSGAVTWFFTKRHFLKIADEEIASVKEMYCIPKNDDITPVKKEEPAQTLPTQPSEDDLKKYNDVIEKASYIQPETAEEPVKKTTKTTKKNTPKLITEEEFGNNDAYVADTLKYYDEDGVLTNDGDEIINATEYIGPDGIEALANTSDTCIYVRNPKLKTDYEVLIYYGSYADMVGESED